MASKYVAAVDGVLVKVGERIVSLYAGGVVPEGAHKEHVEVLVDRGLLVDAPKDDQGAPEENHSSAEDKAAADKAQAEKEAADKAAADKAAADKAAASKTGGK